MLISESAMEVHPSRGALHKVTLKPGELHRPDIAWPTVLLAVFSIMLWTSVAAIGVVREWAPYFTVPVSTAAVYMNFTPLHDAAHASVSRKYRCLNQAVGWMCSVPFLIVPFPLWTWAHLQHHKHTNDPENDPDYNEWRIHFCMFFRTSPDSCITSSGTPGPFQGQHLRGQRFSCAQ
mmetsp:Transcript_48384/g.128374  ORF Transcript_48384/g.128374 Transcript_48384/m.128374 type:complete len:177 (+) Transcript_48384:47-577(+)